MSDNRRIKKIGVEEHYSGGDSNPGMYMRSPYTIDELRRRTVDVSEMRLAVMDECGVVMQVLSSPNSYIHRIQDVAEATNVAKKSNDALAETVAKHPTRFAGFASLAIQDPALAADELERCVTQLGFKGALISVNLVGDNLDHDRYRILWERSEALNAPLYIHPSGKTDVNSDCLEIQGSAWNWGVEVGTTALRVIFSGIFDRCPKATLIIGHLGEMIPYALWRLENKWNQTFTGVNADADLPYKRRTEFSPTYYIKRNLMITTSGHFSEDALICAVNSFGADRIMFSADYPNERIEDAAEFIEKARISEEDRNKICYENAQNLFGFDV